MGEMGALTGTAQGLPLLRAGWEESCEQGAGHGPGVLRTWDQADLFLRRPCGAQGGVGPFAAAEQEVRAHAVIVAGAADEAEPRLARAVFIVAQKRLGNVQRRGGGALGNIAFMTENGKRLRECSVHADHAPSR